MSKTIAVPLDLFYALIDNTTDCLNRSINDGCTTTRRIYRNELSRCEKIKKEEKV